MSSNIALDGSCDLVVEFFECSLYSILYLRGIYPSWDFEQQKRLGTTVLWPNNEDVIAYVDQIIDQLREWLLTNQVCELILLITSKTDLEVLERWQFSIRTDKATEPPKLQDEQQVTSQIKRILRQVAGAVSYLPSLDGVDCTFNIQVHVDPDTATPNAWKEEAEPRLIEGGGEHVRMTPLHADGREIAPYVNYRHESRF
ncbi:DNA-binding protein [Chlamydoabsidia padenii]|nr:DNA-binding protein [Chlamydoabsidia padenii]